MCEYYLVDKGATFRDIESSTHDEGRLPSFFIKHPKGKRFLEYMYPICITYVV